MRQALNRNRTAVDTALSIYEEAMSRHLGVHKTLECVEIVIELRRRGKHRQAQKANQVYKIRNNSRHFAGLKFGRWKAKEDLIFIAKTLREFGEEQSARQVSWILDDLQGGHRPPSHQRGRGFRNTSRHSGQGRPGPNQPHRPSPSSYQHPRNRTTATHTDSLWELIISSPRHVLAVVITLVVIITLVIQFNNITKGGGSQTGNPAQQTVPEPSGGQEHSPAGQLRVITPSAPTATAPATPVPATTMQIPAPSALISAPVSLRISYDASGMMNDRQESVQPSECGKSRNGVTFWTRTVPLRDHVGVADTAGNIVQATEIKFGESEDTWRRNIVSISGRCPTNYQWAEVVLRTNSVDSAPALAGYVAVITDENGDPIGTGQWDSETPGKIRFNLHRFRPEDAYEKPAKLLMYNANDPEAAPTPIPTVQVSPHEKVITLRLEDVVCALRVNQGTARFCDLGELNLHIKDISGRNWKMETVSIGHHPDSARGEYGLYLSSEHRGPANFTGYKARITSEAQQEAEGEWFGGAGNQMGTTSLAIQWPHGYPSEQVTITLYDAFDPASRPAATPTPTLLPTETPKKELTENTDLPAGHN